MLAERTRRVGVSATLEVFAEAERLRRQGVHVVDLGAGEPDFATPEHVKAAARDAIGADFTKYTANAGTLELRQAIAARYRDDYGVTYNDDEIIATAGGKQALYNAMQALFGPGDEVITHAPGWPSIREQIKLSEATPVIVRTHPDDYFRLDPNAVLAAVTARTRGIVINSPANPTGALFSERDLLTLVDGVAGRDIWLVLDLCYEQLVYEPVPDNLPRMLSERMRDRTVLCGSTSKTYAMTGWRCGWMLGPAEVVAACNAIQSHSTSNVCSITQIAATAALAGPQQCVADMLRQYRMRRDSLCAWLDADTRIRFVKPAGAFYLFPDVGELLSPSGIRTSAQFAQTLLDRAHVAVTPGEAFDAPGFVRISYATSMDNLRVGASRILEFVRTLDRD